MEVEKWWVFAATVDSYLMAAKWMVSMDWGYGEDWSSGGGQRVVYL